jgi:hypothetical protein
VSKREQRRQIEAAWDTDHGNGLSLEDAAAAGYGLDLEKVTPRVSIVRQPDGTMRLGRFTLTTTSLDIPQDATVDEWSDVGQTLLQIQGSIQWHLGDWLVYGDAREWGETYQRLAAQFEYEVQTLRVLAMVARNVHPLIRNQHLSFGHHRLVSGLPPEKQRHWLDRAVTEGWTLSQLRDAIHKKPPAPSQMRPGTSAHFSALKAHLRRVGKGDRTAIEKARVLVWDILQWLDDLEGVGKNE